MGELDFVCSPEPSAGPISHRPHRVMPEKRTESLEFPGARLTTTSCSLGYRLWVRPTRTAWFGQVSPLTRVTHEFVRCYFRFGEWPSHPHLPGKLLVFFMHLIITRLYYEMTEFISPPNKLCNCAHLLMQFSHWFIFICLWILTLLINHEPLEGKDCAASASPEPSIMAYDPRDSY